MQKKIFNAILSTFFFFPSISTANNCLELKTVERNNDFIPEGYQDYWKSQKVCGYYINRETNKKFYIEMFDINGDGIIDVSERYRTEDNKIQLYPEAYIFPREGTLLDLYAKQPNGLNGDEFRVGIPKKKFPFYKKLSEK